MKSSKMIEIFKDGNITIPIYFMKIYKKFNINSEEFMLLMYLYNNGDDFTFNPDKISSDMGYDISSVMSFINDLSDKGILKVDVRKNEKGFMEDIVSLEGFYNKLKMIVVSEVNDTNEHDNSTIYEMIEKEFGRTLSPIEFEIIKAWTESNFSDEIIKEAIKEAVFNGVPNLKYIDKILFEWNKKGITTSKDVEENRKKRKNNIQSNKTEDSDIDMDIVDWNWFDDE